MDQNLIQNGAMKKPFTTHYMQPSSQDDEDYLNDGTYIFTAIFNQSPLGLILSFKNARTAAIVSGFETIGSSQGILVCILQT